MPIHGSRTSPKVEIKIRVFMFRPQWPVFQPVAIRQARHCNIRFLSHVQLEPLSTLLARKEDPGHFMILIRRQGKKILAW